MKCRCGGVVARKEETHPDVSLESMNVKMMRTLMILKRRRNRCRGNLINKNVCVVSNWVI